MGGWIAGFREAEDQYVQVDLGHPHFITMLQLAPPHLDRSLYVTKATAECSLNGVMFEPFRDIRTGEQQEFLGTNGLKTTYIWLQYCRYVRLTPVEWQERPALRWDLIQCPRKLPRKKLVSLL